MPKQTALVVASVLVALATLVPAADAHRRRGGRGFDPADIVLQCIRGPWNGDPMESGGNYASNSNRRYKGAFQADRRFELTYAVKLIPAVHWRTLGSDPGQRANTWHPLIQNEMARNGLRARGLSPWPKPNRVCPRTPR